MTQDHIHYLCIFAKVYLACALMHILNKNPSGVRKNRHKRPYIINAQNEGNVLIRDEKLFHNNRLNSRKKTSFLCLMKDKGRPT